VSLIHKWHGFKLSVPLIALLLIAHPIAVH
jgi:hypothetical protein